MPCSYDPLPTQAMQEGIVSVSIGFQRSRFAVRTSLEACGGPSSSPFEEMNHLDFELWVTGIKKHK